MLRDPQEGVVEKRGDARCGAGVGPEGLGEREGAWCEGIQGWG